MELLSVIRKGYPIYVKPIPVKDLRLGMCSAKFRSHLELLNDPEKIVYVKCYLNGGIDWRLRKGDRYEYRIYDVSKHEIADHKIIIKTEE